MCRSMIEAIDAYEGDDPLHPWLQYVFTLLHCSLFFISCTLRLEVLKLSEGVDTYPILSILETRGDASSSVGLK